MQLLFEKSYEYGEHTGLGLIPGEVCPLADDLKDPSLKVPHIGWNRLDIVPGRENDPLFKLAMELERIALSDPYFVQRKLYPNVDFYSGIVQRAIGIPTSLFTAIFALARTVGWIAQWNEMLSDPDYKIGRPRQLFTGSVTRDVPPMDKR